MKYFKIFLKKDWHSIDAARSHVDISHEAKTSNLAFGGPKTGPRPGPKSGSEHQRRTQRPRLWRHHHSLHRYASPHNDSRFELPILLLTAEIVSTQKLTLKATKMIHLDPSRFKKNHAKES